MSFSNYIQTTAAAVRSGPGIARVKVSVTEFDMMVPAGTTELELVHTQTLHLLWSLWSTPQTYYSMSTHTHTHTHTVRGCCCWPGPIIGPAINSVRSAFQPLNTAARVYFSRPKRLLIAGPKEKKKKSDENFNTTAVSQYVAPLFCCSMN